MTALAQKLLDSEGAGGISRVGPTDLEAVCAKVGLTVEHRPLLVDALLQETESGYLAVVNSTNKAAKQRISLAHEIGHLMLYQATGLRQAFGHLSPDERQSDESIEIEELCDIFAFELTMPSDAWRGHILADGMSLTTVRSLMECYRVSIATAAQRLRDIDAVECGVVAWKPVYENGVLVEMEPVRWSERLTPKRNANPRRIPNIPQFRVPGSPIYALETRAETIGKLPPLFHGTAGRYLGQSDIIEVKYVATVIIPERLGWGLMFRNPHSRQAAFR